MKAVETWTDMDSRVKNLVWFSVSTAIIAGLVYIADIGQFVNALKTASPWPMIPSFIFGMSVFLVWSYTWFHFLRKIDIDVNYRETLNMFMSGHFFNSITPMGQFGGEPVMALIISRNTEAGYEESLSTVLSADIMNAIPAFTFVAGGSLFLFLFGSVNDIILQTLYVALVIMALGGVFVYTLWFKAGRIEGIILKILEALSNLLNRGESIVESADESLDRLQEAFAGIGESPRDLLKVGTVAHLGFFSQLLSLYFVMIALGHPTDFTPLYFVLTVSLVSSFAPTPGGQGFFEATMATMLTLLVGVNFATAIAAAILFQLTTYWPGILLGYIAVNRLEIGV
ncbi:MAG: lysylphosphatidylglycerol synthase transmembrane domain-containing protein [Candidatus Nanohaloarchaea archaeon]